MTVIPNRCIWCHRTSSEVVFDRSHVVPESVGNDNQVLPSGVVCRPCNAYFGAKVEPALLADPVFHAQAVMLRLADPEDMNEFRDRMFDHQHPSQTPPARKLALSTHFDKNDLTLDVAYTIEGQLHRAYPPHDLAILSRAVHKIAFEGLAWSVFVRGIDASLDLFSSQFEPVRRWARQGSPPAPVRPVLRFHSEAPRLEWECAYRQFGAVVTGELNLFGDWYAVSLTSTSVDALGDLRPLVPDLVRESRLPEELAKVWVVGDVFSSLDTP